MRLYKNTYHFREEVKTAMDLHYECRFIFLETQPAGTTFYEIYENGVNKYTGITDQEPGEITARALVQQFVTKHPNQYD